MLFQKDSSFEDKNAILNLPSLIGLDGRAAEVRLMVHLHFLQSILLNFQIDSEKSPERNEWEK